MKLCSTSSCMKWKSFSFWKSFQATLFAIFWADSVILMLRIFNLRHFWIILNRFFLSWLRLSMYSTINWVLLHWYYICNRTLSRHRIIRHDVRRSNPFVPIFRSSIYLSLCYTRQCTSLFEARFPNQNKEFQILQRRCTDRARMQKSG